MYKITEKQIKEIAEESTLIKSMFPDVFKVKHEIGKWYKTRERLFFITKFKEEGHALGYGVDSDGWFDFQDEKIKKCACNKYALEGATEATEAEVKEALFNEAIKRGIKKVQQLLIIKEGILFLTLY